jgi:hypothetical protein
MRVKAISQNRGENRELSDKAKASSRLLCSAESFDWSYIEGHYRVVFKCEDSTFLETSLGVGGRTIDVRRCKLF